MAHIILYAEDFPYDIWADYCNICREDVSATALTILFDEFKDVRATYEDDEEEKEWYDIQCDSTTYDEDEEIYYVEADDIDGDRFNLAKINLATKEVEYLEDGVEDNEEVQRVIGEFLENGYVLTE